jgi:hypothetical protein
VQVIGHQNVGENFQSFFLLAMDQATDDKIIVNPAGKHVYPVYYGNG